MNNRNSMQPTPEYVSFGMRYGAIRPLRIQRFHKQTDIGKGKDLPRPQREPQHDAFFIMAQPLHLAAYGVAPIADGGQKRAKIMLGKALPILPVAKPYEQALLGLKLAIAVGDPVSERALAGRPRLVSSPRRGGQRQMQPMHGFAPKQEWLTGHKSLEVGATQPPGGPGGSYRESRGPGVSTLGRRQCFVHGAGFDRPGKEQAVPAALKGRKTDLRKLPDNRFAAARQGCSGNFSSLAAVAERHILDSLGKAVDIVSGNQHLLEARYGRIRHRQFLSVSP
ncbi:MAG: hypothetical protein JHD35_02490 [Sphingopyxis sp.]|nr:hypothetical protein [Sphingopyxis sp.]